MIFFNSLTVYSRTCQGFLVIDIFLFGVVRINTPVFFSTRDISFKNKRSSFTCSITWKLITKSKYSSGMPVSLGTVFLRNVT